MPFAVDSLRWLDGVDMATYQFACKDYVATPPDAFIGQDGALNVYNNFLFEKQTRQTEDMVWRNVVVSKKNQRKWGYDLAQKQMLEWIFERDQYDRMLWLLASSKRTESSERIEKLARRAMDTDSTNLQLVSRILKETGYPRKSKVGDFATLTVWMIIQHSDLGRIKQFLPQLEEAARRGDLAPAYLAATKDRIDIREGRPQKYGTQFNAPLLDASRVNEWRKEVGLPPMEVMNKQE